MTDATEAPDSEMIRSVRAQADDLLGETIREQEGSAIFDLVETIRGLAKAGRAGDASASRRLLEIVDDLPVGQARAVVKSFDAYFQLVNLAEEE